MSIVPRLHRASWTVVCREDCLSCSINGDRHPGPADPGRCDRGRNKEIQVCISSSFAHPGILGCDLRITQPPALISVRTGEPRW